MFTCHRTRYRSILFWKKVFWKYYFIWYFGNTANRVFYFVFSKYFFNVFCTLLVVDCDRAQCWMPTAQKWKMYWLICVMSEWYRWLPCLSTCCCVPCLQVGTLMSAGMLLFCGSCYYHALTGSTVIRRITPYGGMLLIAAWASIML